MSLVEDPEYGTEHADMNSLKRLKDADVSVLRRTRLSSFTAKYAGERDEDNIRSDDDEGEYFRIKGITSGAQQLNSRAKALREKARHARPSGEEGS